MLSPPSTRCGALAAAGSRRASHQALPGGMAGRLLHRQQHMMRVLPVPARVAADDVAALASQKLAGAGAGSPALEMYEQALELSRQERYDAARGAFEDLLSTHPNFCKAWVSYAQMEKRMGRVGDDPLRTAVARQVLQRGLTANPDSGCLAQAWGLMELQKGNMWAAVRLLERSVDMDPFLTPVLRWKPVSVARMTIAGAARGGAGRRQQRGVACAAAAAAQQGGGGGGSAAAPAAGAAGGIASGGAPAAAQAGSGAAGSGSGSSIGAMSSM